MKRIGICGAVLIAVSAAIGAQTSGPIDCSTSKEDINRLRHEKASTLERIAKGATSVMPIGLVLNTVKGSEQQNMEIATGEYNQKIDQRIVEIVHQCGVD